MPRIPVKPHDVAILGVYTPAFKVRDGQLIVTSGLVAVDDQGRSVGVGDAAAQTRQILENLRRVLAVAGGSLDDVIHLRVFSTDMRNREAINRERTKAFRDPLPASTHVQVSRLVREEWLLEIEALAFIPD